MSTTPGSIPFRFMPERIVLAKGSTDTSERIAIAQRICAQFPDAQVEHCPDIPHNRITTGPANNAYIRHRNGKHTLVLGVHKSAVRYSEETGNTCPNYWHYSVFGFCPFGCSYCYLAGTPGVWYAPAVKVYVNIREILQSIDQVARKHNKPVSFYHGKLQDGLAMESITGYMQSLIPFFGHHPVARQIILTKSDAVQSLLSLSHNGHTVLSWSLNPPEIAAAYEPNTPSVLSRIAAMKQCAEAGYPVRAVIMPMIPVPDWQKQYSDFLDHLLNELPLNRLTIGGICSYRHAEHLMRQQCGDHHPIADHMLPLSSAGDGRRRYYIELRVAMYRFIVEQVRSIHRDAPIALCLEEPAVWQAVGDDVSRGMCNCVW